MSRFKVFNFSVCVALLACFCGPLCLNQAQAAPTIVELGDLGGNQYNIASAISADGSTVVGISTSIIPGTTDWRTEAFRWTVQTGMQGLGYVGYVQPGGSPPNYYSIASGVSADGSTVVGESTRNGYYGTDAYVWNQSSGMTSLGNLWGPQYSSYAPAISGDGLTVAGRTDSANYPSGGQAFVWTAANGLVGIGAPPGATMSMATAISGNGSVITGTAFLASGLAQPFLWTQSGGLLALTPLQSGISTFSTAITPDGSVIGGYAGNGNLFLWSAANGYQVIGTEPLSAFPGSNSLRLSSDAKVAVGSFSGKSFIWTQANGLQDFATAMSMEYGVDFTGWSSLSVSDVSGNGLVFTGQGIDATGHSQAWVINLAPVPEPEAYAMLLAGLGFLSFATRRRKFV